MACVELKSVADLSGKKFTVPLYQRGYRWEMQQVKDLLEDIAAFMVPDKDKKSFEAGDSFYCLQPLAVKELVKDKKIFLEALPKSDTEDVLARTREVIDDNIRWEVIDGQQRLTTVWIVLNFLGKSNPYVVEFARWKDEELANIVNRLPNDSSNDTIDEYYIRCANEAIKSFFTDEKASNDYKTRFYKTLQNKVQFIWYEVDEEDPVKVFTRLNIGKIALTNSELIKALFLNRSNFAGDDSAKIRLRQIEIATRWDQIEATLQDDEFWMFFHEEGYDKPTRIDFIFDLMCECGNLDDLIEEKLLGSKENKELLGNDGFRTFRYFNAYFNSVQAKNTTKAAGKTLIEMCWEKVDEIFATFREWFEDLRLYHYVGFLVDQKTEVVDIYNRWLKSNTKTDFLNAYLIPAITEKVEVCRDLDKQYEIEDERGKVVPKTQCRRLLLLHNLQTVINQNRKRSADGRSEVFYKFPFHLYKAEGWDIEHIDSNSTNEISDDESRVEFLANAYSAVSEDQQKAIAEFNPADGNFDKLKNNIEKELKLDSADENDLLDETEKNKVWNFTLLDSHTNRSYGNAIFSAKRRIIIGKDKGKHIPVPRLKKNKDQWIIEPGKEIDAPSSFIPPCTRQVFLKYYNTVVSSPNYWTKDDAKAYRKDIFETLECFGVTMNESTQEVPKGA